MGKHKHYDVIVAAAEGKTIQSRVDRECAWQSVTGEKAINGCSWEEHHEYRIKPEPKYPVTRIGDHELAEIFISTPTPAQLDVIRNGVNIAIRRAIQDGDVILPNKD